MKTLEIFDKDKNYRLCETNKIMLIPISLFCWSTYLLHLIILQIHPSAILALDYEVLYSLFLLILCPILPFS